VEVKLQVRRNVPKELSDYAERMFSCGAVPRYSTIA
jgi:hypothetical protein